MLINSKVWNFIFSSQKTFKLLNQNGRKKFSKQRHKTNHLDKLLHIVFMLKSGIFEQFLNMMKFFQKSLRMQTRQNAMF